jgi:hypothetical protein
MTNPLTEAAACILLGCLFPFIVLAIIVCGVVECVFCAIDG